MIIAERLLIKVPEEMKGLNAHICTSDAALQQAPVVFHPVSMYLALDVFDRVIDYQVRVVTFEPVIRTKVNQRIALRLLQRAS